MGVGEDGREVAMCVSMGGVDSNNLETIEEGGGVKEEEGVGEGVDKEVEEEVEVAVITGVEAGGPPLEVVGTRVTSL